MKYIRYLPMFCGYRKKPNAELMPAVPDSVLGLEHSEAPSDNLVFKHGSVWNVDDVIGVGGDHHSPAQGDVLAESHVARHSQVVQADHVRHGFHTI